MPHLLQRDNTDWPAGVAMAPIVTFEAEICENRLHIRYSRMLIVALPGYNDTNDNISITGTVFCACIIIFQLIPLKQHQ